VYIDFNDIDINGLMEEAREIDFEKNNGVIRANEKMVAELAPKASALLFHPSFKLVAKELLGPFIRAFDESFIQKSVSDYDIPSSKLHFDKRRTFKVWYYPFDVEKDGGGLCVLFPEVA
jgi:hypothetical protein